MQDEQEDSNPFIAMIPGGGWMIYQNGAGSDPVVAWVLCKNGDVIPMVAERNIIVPIERPYDEDHLEFWHPDSCSPAARQRLREHREQLTAGGS